MICARGALLRWPQGADQLLKELLCMPTADAPLSTAAALPMRSGLLELLSCWNQQRRGVTPIAEHAVAEAIAGSLDRSQRVMCARVSCDSDAVSSEGDWSGGTSCQ